MAWQSWLKYGPWFRHGPAKILKSSPKLFWILKKKKIKKIFISKIIFFGINVKLFVTMLSHDFRRHEFGSRNVFFTNWSVCYSVIICRLNKVISIAGGFLSRVTLTHIIFFPITHFILLIYIVLKYITIFWTTYKMYSRVKFRSVKTFNNIEYLFKFQFIGNSGYIRHW